MPARSIATGSPAAPPVMRSASTLFSITCMATKKTITYRIAGKG